MPRTLAVQVNSIVTLTLSLKGGDNNSLEASVDGCPPLTFSGAELHNDGSGFVAAASIYKKQGSIQFLGFD